MLQSSNIWSVHIISFVSVYLKVNITGNVFNKTINYQLPLLVAANSCGAMTMWGAVPNYCG